MFAKVLIANRGEIAVRIARACRELGISTVAVYSTEDRDSAIVSFADEAVHIGAGPAKRSYLNMSAVIEAVKLTGAQAVHPGYGFLSEDPDFAEACEENGIVFIGPPPAVIAQLGDKAAARQFMEAAGVPILPGSREPVQSARAASEVARQIGLPVIVKAVAGGGGRGMRVACSAGEVPAACADAVAEAQAVFGDPRVYVERYVPSARHAEVQILGDAHGNVIQLGLRDCSVQRRHQKLIEESPVPRFPGEVAGRMAESAVRGARAVGYAGAGTFEYLVDPELDFYFMEANCRIQVEHPVTELVTGIDLVQQQLKIAAGHRLALGQADVCLRGAALECRINVEDPSRAFAPSPGRLDTFVIPGGPFVRVDTHAFPGYRVPAVYDPVLAKVLTWAPTRAEAIARMERALGEFQAAGPGIHTTTEFLLEVMRNEEFRAGRHDTGLVARMREKT